MGLNFSYATASEIVFGSGTFNQIGKRVAGKYKNALVVCGKSNNYAEQLLEILASQNIIVTIYNIYTEPTIDVIQEGIELGRKSGCDIVFGIGGGSPIDSAKAIAAMIPNEGVLLDYLEVIGFGKPLVKSPVPCIAIPTTSGTGAEVTKNSVIKSTEKKVKVSLRSDKMYPVLAVVDPLLALSMPQHITASTGVDALTHLMETFVSNQSNPFIDLFCRDGMKRIARSLEKVVKNGNDLEAREDMAMASLL
ncbi:MAG: iron-containing alcohol dehydrogenase, partial [Prolixibacteraceae bacterium]|nr:iron-containing alcohol dehydrogenase [Prolixibacteraceae bacterium]